MKNFKISFFFLLLYFFINLNFSFCQDSIAKNSKNQDSTSKYIYHTSDKLFYDANKKIFELIGNVKIFYSDNKVTCDSFRYFEDKKYGIALGNPRLYNPKVFVRSNIVEIFFEEKKMIAQKNVFIRIKNDKKSSGKSDKNIDNEYFEIYTSKLIYNWQNQNVFIPEKLRIVSKDIYMVSDQLIYNDKTKILILKGNVEGRNKDQYIRANKVTYDLDKDIITIEGNVKSIIKVSDSQEEKEQTKEEKLIAMQANEIYQAVLKENLRIVDYFINKQGFIPNIEIYLNKFTKIEVYREMLEIKAKYDLYDLQKSKIVFLPLGFKDIFNFIDLNQSKIFAFYKENQDNVFFENYVESIDYVMKSLPQDLDSILFSNSDNFSIVVFDKDEVNKWNNLFFSVTSDKEYIKGYFFSFRDLGIFNIFKKKSNNKQAFFIIDDFFWQNFNKNKDIVFSNYDFKVNLLLKIESVKKINYDSNEFFKYIFWKSFLYNCDIFVDNDIYDVKINYFKLIKF